MTQDEINALVNKNSEAVDAGIGKKKNSFKGWLNGENDLILDNLYMKKAYEDHVKKEMTPVEIKYEKVKTLIDVYDREKNFGLKAFDWIYKVSAVLFCIFLVAALIFTVSFMPTTGDPTTPANSNEVPQRYIEQGLTETGAVNIVAGMILDYRAFDTLGESHVLFIATITVLILMRMDKKSGKKRKDYEPVDDPILQTVARFLVPVIFVFGIYVILNGHISPGGGFSGGAIMGAGLILYLNAFGFEKTEKFFTEKLYKLVTFISLAFYACAKCYSFFCGANHLESGISTGTPGAIISAGLILPLNIAVGLVVACTMYAFYAHFRKGGF